VPMPAEHVNVNVNLDKLGQRPPTFAYSQLLETFPVLVESRRQLKPLEHTDSQNSYTIAVVETLTPPS